MAIEVTVPDIGGFKDVSVIDVLVKDGQQIEKETPLVTIETEKAAMDVPSPVCRQDRAGETEDGRQSVRGLLDLIDRAGGSRGARRQAGGIRTQQNGRARRCAASRQSACAERRADRGAKCRSSPHTGSRAVVTRGSAGDR